MPEVEELRELLTNGLTAMGCDSKGTVDFEFVTPTAGRRFYRLMYFIRNGEYPKD